MILTTLTFFIFLLITVIIYYLIPKKYQWFILLISSFIFLFYNALNIANIIYILIILLTAYVSSILIEKYSNTKMSKVFLILGILIILGLLIYLKYTNFLLLTYQYINHFLGGHFTFENVVRTSPIGLSYYSLIMIGYINDVYRDICKPQKNILKCALFMSYFPILTSGPFIKYEDEKENLYTSHKFKWENIYLGIVRILWGLFKILVISERLNILVNTVYGNLNAYNSIAVIIAILAFPVQLYTNFSGSIDMIMGASKMLDINLPENFTSPFYSKTITEFWRNWHITLGLWLKDYVFYPLMKSNIIQSIGNFFKNKFNKNVSKKVTLYISMFIMWLLIGIWHGGAYTYILASGILQFIYMFLEDLLEPYAHKINIKLHINEESKGYKAYQITRTFILFALAMIFFRATSISNGIDIFKSIFNGTGLMNIGLNIMNIIILLISLVILFVIDYINIKNNILEKINASSIEVKTIIICAFVLIILTFGLYGIGFNASDFIYSRI